MSVKEPPLSSRKFVAFLISEISWKVIIMAIMLIGMKWEQVDPWIAGIVMTEVLISGFVEVLYLGGQMALDKYIHLATIATSSGKSPQDLADDLGGKSKVVKNA